MAATIKELSYVGIEADDLDAWSGFAGQLLGLMPARHEDDIRTFRLDDYIHRTIVVRGPRNDLAFAGFDCGSDADLDEVVALLRSKGHDVAEGAPELAAERGVARIYVTADPEGNRVELINGLKKAETPYANEVNKYGFQTRQGGAGHMFLLCTPGGGRERMLEFYSHLGFKLSDYIKDEVAPGVFVDAAFTHCNGRHHTLAFAEMPAPFKLHHFLIENNNMSDVGWAYDRIVEARVPLLHTMGMHPNDKMFSFYAHSPSGIAVEYGWGGLIIEDDDAWEVGEYDSISAWGHKNPMELGTALVELAKRGQELQEAAMKAAAEEGAK
ncbi:VOC family protein [Streptomyces sp. NPDC002577]